MPVCLPVSEELLRDACIILSAKVEPIRLLWVAPSKSWWGQESTRMAQSDD